MSVVHLREADLLVFRVPDDTGLDVIQNLYTGLERQVGAKVNAMGGKLVVIPESVRMEVVRQGESQWTRLSREKIAERMHDVLGLWGFDKLFDPWSERAKTMHPGIIDRIRVEAPIEIEFAVALCLVLGCKLSDLEV